MANLKITELELPGVKIIEPTYFEDFRGYYCETYSKRTMSEYGLNPELKLVRCTRGRVMDYAVDLRKDSPNFKKWVAVELSAENRKQIWIPSGFGHAFITLEDNCEVQYKVDELYYPELDRAIAWNDPDIAIDWGTDSPVISVKDTKAPTLAESDVNFTMEENK